MASCCFIKNAGLQGSTLSGHRMITGFGPFELPTIGLLQRGRDYFPPKACIYLRSPALNWLSQYYKYTVAKQNGGGAEWVELFIMLTRGMGEPTYGLLLSLVMSWWGICEACSVHPVPKALRWILGLYCGDSLAVSTLFFD